MTDHTEQCIGLAMDSAVQNGAQDDATAREWALMWLDEGMADCHCPEAEEAAAIDYYRRNRHPFAPGMYRDYCATCNMGPIHPLHDFTL